MAWQTVSAFISTLNNMSTAELFHIRRLAGLRQDEIRHLNVKILLFLLFCPSVKGDFFSDPERKVVATFVLDLAKVEENKSLTHCCCVSPHRQQG